jgi:hypothetical protein
METYTDEKPKKKKQLGCIQNWETAGDWSPNT